MREIAAIGLTLVILTSCSGDALSPSLPTPSLSSPAPVGRAPLRITWSEQPFEAGAAAVAVDGQHFIAAGQDANGLAAWTSSDGVTWERHAVPDPGSADTLGYSRGVSMGPMARLGDSLYMFGTFSGAGDYRRPVGWRSPDGINWEYIESDNPFFGYGAVVHLTASDTALVAVTDSGLIGPSQNAWRWTPQTSWTQTELTSTTDRAIAIDDVIWSDGRYVAVGATYEASAAPEDEWQPRPAGWVSTDGRAWEPMALPETMLAACAVAPIRDGGFLALGRSPEGAAAWTSSDGATWTDAALIGADWEEGCPSVLVAVEGGLLAAASARGKLIISTSRDGTTWANAELRDVLTGSLQLAVLRDQVIVFTSDGEGGTVLFRGAVHP